MKSWFSCLWHVSCGAVVGGSVAQVMVNLAQLRFPCTRHGLGVVQVFVVQWCRLLLSCGYNSVVCGMAQMWFSIG